MTDIMARLGLGEFDKDVWAEAFNSGLPRVADLSDANFDRLGELLQAAYNAGKAAGREEGITEAADAVASHWNTSDFMVNQKAQAQQSAAALRRGTR